MNSKISYFNCNGLPKIRKNSLSSERKYNKYLCHFRRAYIICKIIFNSNIHKLLWECLFVIKKTRLRWWYINHAGWYTVAFLYYFLFHKSHRKQKAKNCVLNTEKYECPCSCKTFEVNEQYHKLIEFLFHVYLSY